MPEEAQEAARPQGSAWKDMSASKNVRLLISTMEKSIVEGANCGHLLMHPLGSKKADEVTTAIIAVAVRRKDP